MKQSNVNANNKKELSTSIHLGLVNIKYSRMWNLENPYPTDGTQIPHIGQIVGKAHEKYCISHLRT